ncbi:GDSL esterase/lipase At1g29670 [Manihot esculenta]|uniref:GDSL esterase/lipase n=1 Tax=Manihot esculenta TaxID=3983 RepID=A0A2C9UF18_MANES|nr:GDSL esterase/lipase At1g29670 [Manihot esculenta]OAY29069.1 hypothetical protein MANES_15G115600v8 [Manihot esculenta]
MAGRRTKLHLLGIFLLTLASLKQHCVDGESKVPCYFIFGDSLVDSGNNNNLPTFAKANFLPNGIDFPEGPTGRFCNGRTIADVIGELLGFDNFIPPFATANGPEILKGVNYASGSAGIRNETGKHLGVNIDLSTQLQNHQVTISHIVDLLGSKDSATQYLNQCFYLFVIGSNDYIANYFLSQSYNTSSLYTLEQYAQVLIEEFSQQIMNLSKSGARKVVLSGIGPVGCTPGAIASSDTNGSLCVDWINNAINLFNNRLEILVNQLNCELTGAQFIYLNTYGIVSELITSPAFQIKIDMCYKLNLYGVSNRWELPCEDRNLHFFWDAIHPSEIANKVIGGLSYLALRKIL